MTLTMQRPLLKLELGLLAIFLMAAIILYFAIGAVLPRPEDGPYYYGIGKIMTIYVHLMARLLPSLCIGMALMSYYEKVTNNKRRQREHAEWQQDMELRAKRRRGEA